MLDLAIHVIVWMKLCNKNCVLNRRPIDREGLKFNFFSVSYTVPTVSVTQCDCSSHPI